MSTNWGDADWVKLGGIGWPQLRECTYVALLSLPALADDPRAATALAAIRKILSEGAHDPATRVTLNPPGELLSLMGEDV